jgi:quinol monooxygenase YgiN
MIVIWVRAKIKDFNTWKPVFDGNAGIRKAAGEISHRVFYNADNSSDLVLFFEWDSRAKAEAFLHSDVARKAMAEGGLVGEPEIVFVEESRQLRRTAAD